MAEDLRATPAGDDGRDPFEVELGSFRPVPTSPDMGRRIGDRLNGPPASSRVRPWLATAGLAAAACLAVSVVLWRGGSGTDDATPIALVPPYTRPSTGPAPVENRPVPLPTRLAYHRALAESPEALEALLNRRPAGAPRRTGRKAAPVRAFTRSTADLFGPTGDPL